MNNLADKLFEFGFHDTEISDIDCIESSVYLTFHNGLYILDNTGKEIELSDSITMRIDIDKRYMFGSIYNLIEITEFNNQERDVDFLSFKKRMNDSSFEIRMAYYSRFNNTILFDGSIKNKHIMFTIENCLDISYICSSENN